MVLYKTALVKVQLYLRFKRRAGPGEQVSIHNKEVQRILISELASSMAIHARRVVVSKVSKGGKWVNGKFKAGTEVIVDILPTQTGPSLLAIASGLSDVLARHKLSLFNGTTVLRAVDQDAIRIELHLPAHGSCKAVPQDFICHIDPKVAKSSSDHAATSVLSFLHGYTASIRNQHLHKPAHLKVLDLGYGKPAHWVKTFPSVSMINAGPSAGADRLSEDDVISYRMQYESVYLGTLEQTEFATMVANDCGPIDVVSDADSNSPKGQITMFAGLFHKLRPGGTYVVQDIKPLHSAEPSGRGASHFQLLSHSLATESPSIGSIQFAKNVVVITSPGKWQEPQILPKNAQAMKRTPNFKWMNKLPAAESHVPGAGVDAEGKPVTFSTMMHAMKGDDMSVVLGLKSIVDKQQQRMDAEGIAGNVGNPEMSSSPEAWAKLGKYYQEKREL